MKKDPLSHENEWVGKNPGFIEKTRKSPVKAGFFQVGFFGFFRVGFFGLGFLIPTLNDPSEDCTETQHYCR